jgi:hypothetical protein
MRNKSVKKAVLQTEYEIGLSLNPDQFLWFFMIKTLPQLSRDGGREIYKGREEIRDTTDGRRKRRFQRQEQ